MDEAAMHCGPTTPARHGGAELNGRGIPAEDCPPAPSLACISVHGIRIRGEITTSILLFVPSHELISLLPWEPTASIADLETAAVNSPRTLRAAALPCPSNADAGDSVGRAATNSGGLGDGHRRSGLRLRRGHRCGWGGVHGAQ